MLRKDEIKTRVEMRYEIKSLETTNSLELAKNLSDIVLDEHFVFFANMKWVRPFGMLLAASAIKQFRKKHIETSFSLETNLSKDAITYAAHMGFVKAISENITIGKLPGEANGNDNYIPITELDLHSIHKSNYLNGNLIGLGDAIEAESFRLAKILSRNNEEMQKLMTYLIREILRNIPEHAESHKAWICGQYWSDNTAEIAILDEGIGVKESLRKNTVHRKYINTDEDAIKCSIKAGISQAFQPSKKNTSDDPWANSGFGLYMVSQICKELHGSFCLASGNKYINIYHDGQSKVGDTNFQGTAVKITFSTENLSSSKEIIAKIAKQGEEQAKTIRNAFKQASLPSKGLIENLF